MFTIAVDLMVNKSSSPQVEWKVYHRWQQKPIARRVQFPYCVCETVFLQVGLLR